MEKGPDSGWIMEVLTWSNMQISFNNKYSINDIKIKGIQGIIKYSMLLSFENFFI